MEVVFLLHSLFEFFLGAIKLRGKYGVVDMPIGAEKFARHHGVSLLAISLLGFMAWRQKLVHTSTGLFVSKVLAVFHAGCVAVLITHAGGFSSTLVHSFFAAGFTWHALGRSG